MKMDAKKVEEMRKGLHDMVDMIVELAQKSDYDLKVSMSRNIIKKPTDYGIMEHAPGNHKLITISVGPLYLIESMNQCIDESHEAMVSL